MLWDHYVFRRGAGCYELWGDMFKGRRVRLLYIAGNGFDVRGQSVITEFLDALQEAGGVVESAQLVLVGLGPYELSEELLSLTDANASALRGVFSRIGSCKDIAVGSSGPGGNDLSSSAALRMGTRQVLAEISDHTDVVLDVSSLPRATYLSLLVSLLERLVPDKLAEGAQHPLESGGVNFQVLVAEDAALDGRILAEDPSNDLVLVPGFSGALHAESVQEWPLVWFPILGENRVAQLEKVMAAAIPSSAEICPVLPSPSRNPRRADELLIEYIRPLFDVSETPKSNVLYVHESHPFEAYRQLLGAMKRFRDSLMILGGCRLVVTPLSSKLITLGTGLACFEMRPSGLAEKYGVAIPHAEPTRYLASVEDLQSCQPEISSLVLTGEAYSCG